ncbi:MAG TPA: T9SS type A sorting domain-containing protein [Paludibacteraceae bacterium]|nr:T9SS type A sorting domain-containing protein [Paludibacteraceae bacterium]
MKKLIILFLSIILTGPAITCVYGQQVHASLNASGGNTESAGGSVSYSVGQVFFSTTFSTNGSISEGVQQPFEISVLSGLEDVSGIDLFYTVYPNPTSGKLTLKIEKIDLNQFAYQLFDVNGKMLRNDKLKESETDIEMSDLISSTYFLKVTKDNKEVKLFKIIKN